MKAYEVMNLLYGYGADADYSNTCDTLKAGNPDNEVTKVAVSMFATIGVVKAAKEWGAQLLVVHEPTYYNHMDHRIEISHRYVSNFGVQFYFESHDKAIELINKFGEKNIAKYVLYYYEIQSVYIF